MESQFYEPVFTLEISEDRLWQFADIFTKNLDRGDFIALYGELGVGKTSFARLVIQQLCGNIKVPSPSFSLVQYYQTLKLSGGDLDCTIIHADFYRFEDPSESHDLGIFDDPNAIILAEWAQLGDFPDMVGYGQKLWQVTIADHVQDTHRYYQIHPPKRVLRFPFPGKINFHDQTQSITGLNIGE